MRIATIQKIGFPLNICTEIFGNVFIDGIEEVPKDIDKAIDCIKERWIKFVLSDMDGCPHPITKVDPYFMWHAFIDRYKYYFPLEKMVEKYGQRGLVYCSKIISFISCRDDCRNLLMFGAERTLSEEISQQTRKISLAENFDNKLNNGFGDVSILRIIKNRRIVGILKSNNINTVYDFLTTNPRKIVSLPMIGNELRNNMSIDLRNYGLRIEERGRNAKYIWRYVAVGDGSLIRKAIPYFNADKLAAVIEMKEQDPHWNKETQEVVNTND